jgi:hypothetical protein
MNWNTTIRELADRGELHRDNLVMAALAKDTIYMPSEVAAVRLPLTYAGIDRAWGTATAVAVPWGTATAVAGRPRTQ